MRRSSRAAKVAHVSFRLMESFSILLILRYFSRDALRNTA
jgi:hypothetical protein